MEILLIEHKAAGTYAAHSFSRQRNNARDQRPYDFEYIHRFWAKNPAIRQIIVRATNPHGRTVQLSILSDDAGRPVQAIVSLIFNRWVQENDFKYLDKHFGINQLTSYRSTPYQQLRDQLSDRQVPNHAYVEKVKIARQLDQQKSRLLLADDNNRDDHGYCRQLTQCDGVLRWTGSEIEVHLVTQVNYPPKLRKIIEKHLADLKASGLSLPDGSHRPLRLRLTRKEQISIRIHDVSET